jgi:hypothetical protein
MKTSYWHRIVLALLGLALCALFGACGTPPDQTPATDPTLPPTHVPDPTATLPSDPTAPAQPSPTPVQPSSTPAADYSDQATFVGDVTIPDGTVVTPGQSFVKTWRLLNSGTCTWNTDYTLAFAGGTRMGGPAAIPLPGIVAPGSTVDLSVALTAPASNGTYGGYWQLYNDDGAPFGLSSGSDTIVVRVVVATASPTPTPPATPPPVSGWYGEYYANPDLSGSPALVRDDAAIDFDWDTGAPAGGLPADGFSVRWTRTLSFVLGTYRFSALVDDGVRLYVDDELVLNAWKDGARREVTATAFLLAGDHSLRIEYYDRTGRAFLQLSWDKIAIFPEWQGEYWSNPKLHGDPALVQNESRIDFNWGSGSVAGGMPVDNFSARWTRTLDFNAATYRFHILMDDGARLWVDGRLVIDAWQGGGAHEVTADVKLGHGEHSLRAEYFERTGEAQMHLWWEMLPDPSFPDWKGQYWGNMGLQGDPKLVRNDAAIDFDWGTAAAAPCLPVDHFSARWSRQVDFLPDVYMFYARADNGIRVYLDGTLIIDAWSSNGKQVHTARKVVSGTHTLVVEYFDSSGAALARFWWEPAGMP